MAQKPIKTLEKFQLINISFALGIIFLLAMSQITTISELVFNALNSIQWPEQISHVAAIILTWWLPSSLLFAIFRLTNLLDWLKINRLTKGTFLIANIAFLGELAFLLLYGREGYFMRWYFEAPWKFGLMIGGASLIGCTVWYQVIKPYPLVRNSLFALLASD